MLKGKTIPYYTNFRQVSACAGWRIYLLKHQLCYSYNPNGYRGYCAFDGGVSHYDFHIIGFQVTQNNRSAMHRLPVQSQPPNNKRYPKEGLVSIQKASIQNLASNDFCMCMLSLGCSFWPNTDSFSFRTIPMGQRVQVQLSTSPTPQPGI